MAKAISTPGDLIEILSTMLNEVMSAEPESIELIRTKADTVVYLANTLIEAMRLCDR
jgi:hypothetical protein